MATFKLNELQEAARQIAALGALSLDVQLAVRVKRIRKRIAGELETWAEQYNEIIEEFSSPDPITGEPGIHPSRAGWTDAQKKITRLGLDTCEIEGWITEAELKADLAKSKPAGYANILFGLDPLIVYDEEPPKESE
jgi:hypothetical protein